jgi:hypothetical protein
LSDGRTYEGWWHANMMTGGTIQQGMWKENKLEGKYQPGPADGSNTKPRRK